LQLSLSAAIELWLPGVRDSDYVAKREQLQAHRAERPERPFVLVLGSSRVQGGLQAGRLSAGSSGGTPALVYNFAMPGCGPLLELVLLQRLLAEGIRPDLLYVEVFPAHMNQYGNACVEEGQLDAARLTGAEMLSLIPCYAQPRRLFKRWALARYLPATSFRAELRDYLAVDREETEKRPAGSDLLSQDRYGWQTHRTEVTPEQRQRYVGLAQRQYGPGLKRLHPAAQPALALGELLRLCRRAAIPVTLLLMPEGSEFAELYGPTVRAGLDTFLAGFCREHHVSLVDARGWVPDRGFWDSHHLLPAGAVLFSDRFGREVLWPQLHALQEGGKE
jgi:hypothetical protein